jgi:mycothiol synthase
MELLAARGFACVRHFWRMDVDLAEAPERPVWPDGIAVRTFRPGADERRTYDATTEAFLDHWGDGQRTFEQWTHHKITGPAARFDPGLWFLATEGDEVVGVSLCIWESDFDPQVGYVTAVGVRPAWRRRGVARALLLHTFAAFRARGRAALALHVDAASVTGALALYEGVGMRAEPCFEVWEKPLPA